jgi:hypothetical protein
MASDPAKILREAPRVNLAIAKEIHKGHRNAALFFGIVSFAFIWWRGWNKWIFIVPIIIWLYACLRHWNVLAMDSELKRRDFENNPGTDEK